MTQAPKLTAASIRSAMSARWAPPEWALMWEVRESTGSVGGRSADAVMMSLWPSRGLEIHGVEIKVSRSDWRREAADPSKAEAVAQYCDRWWVHAAPGVVPDLSELPPAWGLREWSGRAWMTLREAEKTAAVPASRGFLAALLRRADETMRLIEKAAEERGAASIEAERERLRAEYDNRLTEAVRLRTQTLETAAGNIAEFNAAFGPDAAVDWSIDHAALGRAAKVLHECRRQGYQALTARLRAAADEIDAIHGLVEPNEAIR